MFNRKLFNVALLCLLATSIGAQDKPRTSCIARKNDIVTYNRETKATTESVDWIVDCTIKLGDKQIFAGPLPLLHPSTFPEAMGAIEEFMTKKAPQIVKDYLRNPEK